MTMKFTMEEIKQGLKEPCFFIACLESYQQPVYWVNGMKEPISSASNTSQSLMKMQRECNWCG